MVARCDPGRRHAGVVAVGAAAAAAADFDRYFQSFVAKLEGETWRRGTAVYWVTMVSDYRRLPVPAAMRASWWSRLATWGTLLLEFSLGPLVWMRELRYPLVAAAAVFHIGLEVLLNLQLFGAIMLAGLTTFISPYDLERLVAGLRP